MITARLAARTRLLAQLSAGLLFAGVAGVVGLGGFGCSAATGDAPAGPAGEDVEGESLKSPCGVVVVGNRTDGNYCGFIKIRNNGATPVHHWVVDALLPAGARVDSIDGGITYTQSGTHVRFVPDAAHATLNAKASYEITFCNSDTASLLASSPVATSELCPAGADGGSDGGASDAGSTDTGTTADTSTGGSDTGAPTDTGSGATDTGTKDSSPPPSDTGTGTESKTPLGKYVVTWYSFQDNTPVNSALSASGRKLVPYISVAVPFRLLKPFGGKMNYGDHLYVEFLDGRTMPNGLKHTGWVQIDDFCGDSGDDSYCFQDVGGTKYPNTDLYIGDFTKSAMDPKACSGPAGSGQELTNVSTGTPGSKWIADYGGKALGSGKCGDLSTAKPQQGACWDYTPPASSASDCAGCSSTSCTSW